MQRFYLWAPKQKNKKPEAISSSFWVPRRLAHHRCPMIPFAFVWHTRTSLPWWWWGCVCWSLSCVWLFVTQWIVVHQALLCMRILQARILERVAIPFSRGSSQLRDWTCVSYTAGAVFTAEPLGVHREESNELHIPTTQIQQFYFASLVLSISLRLSFSCLHIL